MPPKKRTLAETDSNIQPPSKRTSAKKGAKAAEQVKEKPKEEANKHKATKQKTATMEDPKNAAESENAPEVSTGGSAKDNPEKPMPNLPDDHISNRPPYLYICMNKAFWFTDGDSDSESATEEQPDMHNKLASSHPTWPYTIMAESYRKLGDWIRRGKYTDPDRFGMYIYNDFHGYGLVELLENLLVEFNEGYVGKDVQKMWSVTATMGHWINHDETDHWLTIDDGERAEELFEVVGCMLLTVLDCIEREGELTSGKFRDLGLVMALFAKCAAGCSGMGVESGEEWMKDVVAYAKLAKIDLDDVGVDGMAEDLEEYMPARALSRKKAADRWQWKKQFKSLGKIGGDDFNIVAMSRKDRAKHAFDKKDPLADVSDEKLKNEVLDFA